jgi:hypothetical protein
MNFGFTFRTLGRSGGSSSSSKKFDTDIICDYLVSTGSNYVPRAFSPNPSVGDSVRNEDAVCR